MESFPARAMPNRIRYWDPLLARLFPPSTRILIRHDPRGPRVPFDVGKTEDRAD
jgi:hypothetical protein